METGPPPPHTNRLAQSKSPYLLQHAHNPVDWYPWGEEAFEKARREDKPIFLSIGYSTCHWCHVMERESFENERIAGVLNSRFVSIKLDREERPDVDKVFMTAVHAMGIAGGWPLSVWLTPDLTPFYGGTYFPPEGRFGRPGFVELLGRIAAMWSGDRERILASASEMLEHIRALADVAQPSEEISAPQFVRAGAEAFKADFDAGHGGFGAAPKFPRPVVLRFLLRHARRNGDAEAREMVFRTLEAMARGGLRDHLGGGFARYSVDAEWLVPHFEKMLYDNAQLLDAYVDAIQVLDSASEGDPKREAARRRMFAGVVEETIAYLQRDMTAPEGAFYAAEDADSEGREGAFYVWTVDQVRSALDGKDADFAAALLGVTAEGNFVDHSAPPGMQPPGENVLQRALPPAEAAQQAGLKVDDPDAAWLRIRDRMHEARSKRRRPHRDDKVLTSWNGLAIGAIARAGAVLGRPEWTAAARKAAAFFRERQFDDATGHLGHVWRDGAAPGPALLDDYAFLAGGLMALYEATFEAEWLRWAERLCDEAIRRFGDTEASGFFMSPAGEGTTLVRMKEDHDGAEPSGNSAMTLLLLKLGRALERQDFEQWAGRCLKLFARHMERAPHVVPNFLSALDQWHGQGAHLVLVGDAGSDVFQELAREGRRVHWPDLLLARGGEGSPLPIARGLQPPPGAHAAAFLCREGRCEAPILDVSTLRRMLGGQERTGDRPDES